MSLLTSSTLFPFFCPLLPVDAFLPGRVVLTRGLFPHSDRPCAVFFLPFFVSNRSLLLWCSFFFSCLFFFYCGNLLRWFLFLSVFFFSVAISCSGFHIFCLFLFVFVCYVCCVYSYNVWLVIMNMGCRSMICMIGYCHCQFVREGGARLVGQLVTLCSMHQR